MNRIDDKHVRMSLEEYQRLPSRPQPNWSRLVFHRTVVADVLKNHKHRPGEPGSEPYHFCWGERSADGEEHETQVGERVREAVKQRVLGGCVKGLVFVDGIEYRFETGIREV